MPAEINISLSFYQCQSNTVNLGNLRGGESHAFQSSIFSGQGNNILESNNSKLVVDSIGSQSEGLEITVLTNEIRVMSPQHMAKMSP